MTSLLSSLLTGGSTVWSTTQGEVNGNVNRNRRSGGNSANTNNRVKPYLSQVNYGDNSNGGPPLPDSTVRFGRVPKREKAKILAAMQKVNADVQERALSVELEDESKLMAAIIRAHDETCDYTKDKVIPLLERARTQPVFTHCPSQLACPLNPPPQSADGSTRIVEDFSERFWPAIRGVVEFAKRIPGFSLLAQDDQVTLLKAGVFEVLLVRLACMFDHRSNAMICLNGQILRREAIHAASNARFLLDSMFDFAERLNALGLSDNELGLFSAVVVIAPDRPGIRNVELVNKVQKKLSEVLQKAISLSHPDRPSLFDDLMKKIPDLRTLNTLHSEKLLAYKMEPHIKEATAANSGGSSLGGSSSNSSSGAPGSPAASLKCSRPNSASGGGTYAELMTDPWVQYTCLNQESSVSPRPEDRSRSPGQLSVHNGSDWSTADSKDGPCPERFGSPRSVGSSVSVEEGKSPIRTASFSSTRSSYDAGVVCPRSNSSSSSSSSIDSPLLSQSLHRLSPHHHQINQPQQQQQQQQQIHQSSPQQQCPREQHQAPPQTLSVLQQHLQQPPYHHPHQQLVQLMKRPRDMIMMHHQHQASLQHQDQSSSDESFIQESSNCSPMKSHHLQQHNQQHQPQQGMVILNGGYPKIRRVDSPTDSGIESGKEHGGAGHTPTASLCSSPHSSMEEKVKEIDSEFGDGKQSDIDDMPVLKRALQAPPLINTTMLMDEAYRHHKKFRAARKDVDSSPSSPSSIPASAVPTRPTLASAHSTLVKTLEQAPRYLNEQQLKRTDLIHNIIMRNEAIPAHCQAAMAVAQQQESKSFQQQQQVVMETGFGYPPSHQQHHVRTVVAPVNHLHHNQDKNMMVCPPGYYSSTENNHSNPMEVVYSSGPSSPSSWSNQSQVRAPLVATTAISHSSPQHPVMTSMAPSPHAPSHTMSPPPMMSAASQRSVVYEHRNSNNSVLVSQLQQRVAGSPSPVTIMKQEVRIQHGGSPAPNNNNHCGNTSPTDSSQPLNLSKRSDLCPSNATLKMES